MLLYTRYPQTNVFVEDLRSCISPEYLTDGIIDASLHLLFSGRDDVQCLPASVLSVLFSDKVTRKKININNKKVILLPWCQDRHWRLIVVKLADSKWYLIDPMGSRSEENINRIQEDVIKPFIQRFSKNPIQYNEMEENCPRQVDMFSCGSSIVQYGASLVDGKSVFEMDDSFTYRDKIISRLIDQPLPNLLSYFCSYCGIYWNCKKGSSNVFNCCFCER